MDKRPTAPAAYPEVPLYPQTLHGCHTPLRSQFASTLWDDLLSCLAGHGARPQLLDGASALWVLRV